MLSFRVCQIRSVVQFDHRIRRIGRGLSCENFKQETRFPLDVLRLSTDNHSERNELKEDGSHPKRSRTDEANRGRWRTNRTQAGPGAERSQV